MQKINSLFARIPHDAQDILNSFDKILQDIQPLSPKQRLDLPRTIRTLSHNLTDERSERRVGYVNESATLCAYTRYFMWWNLVRLVPLFASLPAETFYTPQSADDKNEAVFLDIGSGPLTVPIALYLAQPALREKKITFYCVDISQKALAAGEEILLAVMSKIRPTVQSRLSHADTDACCDTWKIIRVKDIFGTSIKQKADTVFCANMFNELYWNNKEPLEAISKKYAAQLHSYTASDGMVFVVEPGVPRAARFVSLLRDSLLRLDFHPVAPCPHEGECPMSGLKNGKWCHFVCDTEKAPSALLSLSKMAGIPKERATLSFICSSKKAADPVDEAYIPVRIVSDSIRLSPLSGEQTRAGGGTGGAGRYACSSLGLTIVGGQGSLGWAASSLHSGDLIRIAKNAPRYIDGKSNAVVLPSK